MDSRASCLGVSPSIRLSFSAMVTNSGRRTGRLAPSRALLGLARMLKEIHRRSVVQVKANEQRLLLREVHPLDVPAHDSLQVEAYRRSTQGIEARQRVPQLRASLDPDAGDPDDVQSVEGDRYVRSTTASGTSSSAEPGTGR